MEETTSRIPRFNGQHDDERVLYVVTPHWTMLAVHTLGAVLTGALLYVVLMRWGVSFQLLHPRTRDELQLQAGLAASMLGAIIWLVGYLRFINLRTFLTDRRVVRFGLNRALIPTRRTLLWPRVGKVKGFYTNPVLWMMRVGTLKFESEFGYGSEDVRMPYTWYYEDLANYVEKILHLNKTKPDEIAKLHLFVPKPKGQRY